MTRSVRTKRRLQEAWTNPGAFATTLLVLFVDAYDTDAFQWHPETINNEINDDFTIELPRPNLDRLMVAISLITTDSFYRSVVDFIDWCNVLNGDTIGNAWEMADASEIAWGVTEALLIEPPEEDDPFSPEIIGYINAVLRREGIVNPPDVLKLGVLDSGVVTGLPGEFSDDPEMFAAIYEFENAKTAAINSYIKDQLQTLAEQLEALPLQSGNTRDVVDRVLQNLNEDHRTAWRNNRRV